MITHDSWKRIKEIFLSAQELSPAERSDFLDKACADDPSIREEVEALLTADASNEDFLSAPAYEFAADILIGEELDEEENEFSNGQKIGRYEILCPLGSGGMGQIYLVQDAALHRKIALKLISPQFAHDIRRVHRFEQEALAASALNHPNICVIHEIGQTESGRHFIAMEHIQGVTLREQMSHGGFSVRKALDVAVQVATALASAHASGIVHRDIKPENIMLRPDGYVKILDFGLAKLTDFVPDRSRLPEIPSVHTETGMLMGTVKYMSPEQLRETKVDERTDIWSLGIVLYEMLTGTTPFEAPTSSAIVDAIVAPQRTPLAFPEGMSARLHYTITKALEKDRDHRYQTVTKFAADLKALQNKLPLESDGEFDLSAVPASEQRTQKILPPSGIFTRLKSQAIISTEFILSEIRSHKRAAIFAGATGMLAFLLFLPGIVGFINNVINRPGVVKTLDMTPVTNDGTSTCAAISSDGKLIAHTEEKDGKQRLMLTNRETSKPLETVPAMEAVYLGLAFTHDSNFLYFTRIDSSGSNLYRLAIPSGTPVKIKEFVDSPISLSPEGDRFAFVRFDKNAGVYSLMISSIEGADEQVVATRQDKDAFSVYGLAWSPDGKLIVCPTSSFDGGYKVSLMGFDLKNHTAQPIGDQPWFAILEISWQDDMGSFIMSARDHAAGPFRLWRITYPDGAVKRLTTDLAEYMGFSMSGQDGVTVRSDISWELMIARADANFENPSTIASGSGLNYGLTWAGNNKIVFSSMVQDKLNISQIDVDGTNQNPLSKDGDNYTPAASRDGRFIVFSSNRNGKSNIWRTNADGSDPKQLTFSDGNYYPSISPDNQWVVYDNQENRQFVTIWKVPLEGGDAVKIIDGYRMPAYSPDNQRIAVRYDEVAGTNEFAIYSAQGGELVKRVPIPKFDWQRVYWLSTHTVTYIDKVGGYSNIWSYDLDTGAKKQLTNFNRKQIFAYAWSPDYKLLACQLGTTTRNVVLAR